MPESTVATIEDVHRLLDELDVPADPPGCEGILRYERRIHWMADVIKTTRAKLADALSGRETAVRVETLRDKLAGRALPVAYHAEDRSIRVNGSPEKVPCPLEVATRAYGIADAMLAVRDRKAVPLDA